MKVYCKYCKYLGTTGIRDQYDVCKHSSNLVQKENYYMSWQDFIETPKHKNALNNCADFSSSPWIRIKQAIFG